MTEKKRQPREQLASHVYGRRAAPADLQSVRSKAAGRASPRQRVVTMPAEVPPTAGDRYVQRRNQLYSARAQQQTYTHLTPRTLAQTGVPASSGQIRAVKRLPQYHPSPIPLRSGRSSRGRNVLLRLLALFALLLVVGLGANFALTSATFRIAQVSIVGTHNMLLVHTIQHMGIRGQNIFLIDAAPLTARIELLPMVSSASLQKQWPDRLQVVISERTPALFWQTSNGAFSVDKNGLVIAPDSQANGTGSLQSVVDRSNRAGASGLRPGSRLPAVDIAFALAIFAQLPRVADVTDFSLSYTSMAGQAAGSFVIASKAGWLAYLGGADDANPLANRLLELQQILLLAQQEQLGLATIDLRFGLRPVYTLKKM